MVLTAGIEVAARRMMTMVRRGSILPGDDLDRMVAVDLTVCLGTTGIVKLLDSSMQGRWLRRRVVALMSSLTRLEEGQSEEEPWFAVICRLIEEKSCLSRWCLGMDDFQVGDLRWS